MKGRELCDSNLERRDCVLVCDGMVFGFDLHHTMEINLKVIDLLGGFVVNDQGVGQRIWLQQNALIESRGHKQLSRVKPENKKPPITSTSFMSDQTLGRLID